MRKIISIVFFITCLLSLFSSRSFGAEDPLQVPNNKIGVHILFTSEVKDAARVVNANGGDWGYVIIPIQSGDKDIKKWQTFMDQAREFHLIPIIRLATQGDYFNTAVWSKPTYTDILDFANFLDSLSWPTKNRYVVIYNEVNRDDEWGGDANPTEYAQILSYAVTAFKTKNPDFFIISAGMDNAAANSATAINEYTFFRQMNAAVPGIFNQIDGIASHSYPNPAFSQPPNVLTNESIASFRYERDLISSLSSKSLPVFITETGWSREHIPDATIAAYFTTAYTSVWSDNSVAAVMPFLLTAGSGPFENFSLLTKNLEDTPISKAIETLTKIKGQPLLTPKVLAAETVTTLTKLPIKDFSDRTSENVFRSTVRSVLHFLLGEPSVLQ